MTIEPDLVELAGIVYPNGTQAKSTVMPRSQALLLAAKALEDDEPMGPGLSAFVVYTLRSLAKETT